MSAVQQLSETYDYNPHAHDYRAWWDHHRALVRGMEPAKWPERREIQIDFSDADVVEIRETYARGTLNQYEIASAYGCSQTTINKIVNGYRYRNVGGPLTHRGVGHPPPNRRSA